jgi:putative SOS response-associated peptidase YedK
MCGRYDMNLRDDELQRRFQARFRHEELTASEGEWLRPRYNIAPSQYLPIVLSQDAAYFVFGRWGYKPEWAQERKDVPVMINARAETVGSKPFFRDALRHRRCLIPATGFFEWKREGGRKVPFRCHLRSEEAFAFAGIYSTLRDEEGTERAAYAIITTEANQLVARVHQRMPVILRQEAERDWLNPRLSHQAAQSMLVSYPEEEMRIYRVSEMVNSPRNDTAQVSTPVEG